MQKTNNYYIKPGDFNHQQLIQKLKQKHFSVNINQQILLQNKKQKMHHVHHIKSLQYHKQQQNKKNGLNLPNCLLLLLCMN